MTAVAPAVEDVAPTPAGGLSDAEAALRRAAGHGNAAPPATSRTYLQIVRENVFTFINNVIFVLGVLLIIVGRPMDALVSIGVIGTNILVSVIQEVRAKRMLDRIALLTRPTATLVRDGAERAAQPEELVVGDLLRVGAGDQVILDGRLVDGSLEADESQLTGESDLVPKRPGDPVYSGSFVVNGGGRFVATAVGTASLANRITAGARTFRRSSRPCSPRSISSSGSPSPSSSTSRSSSFSTTSSSSSARARSSARRRSWLASSPTGSSCRSRSPTPSAPSGSSASEHWSSRPTPSNRSATSTSCAWTRPAP